MDVSRLSGRNMAILFLGAMTIFGILISYRWEVIGGILIVGAWFMHAKVSPRMTQLWFPYVIPVIGLLFLYCGVMSYMKKDTQKTREPVPDKPEMS